MKWQESVILAALAAFVVMASGCEDREKTSLNHANQHSNVFVTGHALAGIGEELANVDLMIGNKDGPIGIAVASSLTHQREGHSNIMVTLDGDHAVKPTTILANMVTIKGTSQATNFYNVVQLAIARGIEDSVKEGSIPKEELDNWVIVCTVFIHPSAKDTNKLSQNNRQAVKLAIQRAIKKDER